MVLICSVFFFVSCSNRWYKDCIRIFDTEYATTELDNLVQNIYYKVGGCTNLNGNTIDTILSYADWNDFVLTHLNKLYNEHQYCDKTR